MRPLCALCTLGSLGSLGSSRSLCACGALSASRPLGTGRALGAGCTLGSRSALRSLRTLGSLCATLRSLRARWPLRPARALCATWALWSLRSLSALWALRSLRPGAGNEVGQLHAPRVAVLPNVHIVVQLERDGRVGKLIPRDHQRQTRSGGPRSTHGKYSPWLSQSTVPSSTMAPKLLVHVGAVAPDQPPTMHWNW